MTPCRRDAAKGAPYGGTNQPHSVGRLALKPPHMPIELT